MQGILKLIQIFFCGLEKIFVTRVSPTDRASPAHVNLIKGHKAIFSYNLHRNGVSSCN